MTLKLLYFYICDEIDTLQHSVINAEDVVDVIEMRHILRQLHVEQKLVY